MAHVDQLDDAAADQARDRARARARAGSRGYWLLVGLIVMVAFGKAILADTMDPDAFWHLRVADQLIADGIRPLVDQISFASIKTPWTPYSWLAELFMRDVWNLGGYHAATAVTALCSAGIVVFTARACRARTTNLFASLLCTVAAAWLTLPFVSFRPVTFALLLFAIIIDLLARPSKRGIWLIPPIVLLMTNLHLYAGLCAIAVTLVAVASWWDDRGQFVRNALLALLTLAAACGTPMIAGTIATALRYNGDDPMVAANYITEMRPFWWGVGGKVSLGIVIGCALLLLTSQKKHSVADWLLVAIATALLFRLGRFAPVFAILALPRIARLMPAMDVRVIRKPLIQFAVAGVLGFGVFNLCLQYPRQMTLDDWLNRNGDNYPTAAARFVDERVLPMQGRIINEFNWGGYLAWRLGDRYQVLMDGRTQLYTPDFWRATHLGNEASRTALLTTIDADAAILPADQSAFMPALVSLGWREVYRDKLAVVMTR